MIDHKQSVAEHRLEAERQEELAAKRLARRVGRAILRAMHIMAEEFGEDTANYFFTPVAVRARAKIAGVQKELLYLVEETVTKGREHD